MFELRRGFKSEANEIAREVRGELGLKLADPLDPLLLAVHLEIPVIALSELAADAPSGTHHFLHVAREVFSAVTVFSGTERVIVHNDSHSPGRQSSNIAHELSHGLLLHPATPALGPGGCRDWDPMVEQEAEWLAGALLISEEAALWIARQGLTLDQAASHYGVSRQMIQFRLNVTGARRRVSLGRSTFSSKAQP